MATQIAMLITLLLATGVMASSSDLTPVQQKACVESDTNQQCDAVNEPSGAVNSESGRFQGDEELSLLQERILVSSTHAARKANGATLSTSQVNQTTSLEETTENTLPVGVAGSWFAGNEIKNHPRCRWPFPHLKPYYGSSGDVCYTDTVASPSNTRPGHKETYFCPDGCVGAEMDGKINPPWCIQQGTRDACKETNCPDMWPGDDVKWTQSEAHVTGSRVCRMGAATRYIVPRGCVWATPPGWSFPTSVEVEDHGKLCRVEKVEASLPVQPVGMWNLVGSKNNAGDAQVDLEVGYASATSKSATKADVKSKIDKWSSEIGMAVVGPGVMATASVSVEVETEKTSAILDTVRSASEYSHTHKVSITCPGMAGRMVWVYQWQIANAEASIKSEHFRCHYSMDGYERPPQCPPNQCGDPGKNPYCLASNVNARGANGRDSSCITKAPVDPGCYYWLPSSCLNHPHLGAGVWHKDNVQGAKTHKTWCQIRRKKEYDEYCGVQDTVTLWVPTAEYMPNAFPMQN